MRIQSAAGLVALTSLIGTMMFLPKDRRPIARTSTNEVFDKIGTYTSPDGKCHATLKIATMGGFLILTAGQSGKRNLKVNDVTGMAWVHGHELAYTTSPIYGIPGVYVYICGSGGPKQIVAPRTKTKANPDGADFFELARVSMGEPTNLYFYYARDVEKVDFTKFRSRSYLFQVHTDGTDFRKAQTQ